MDNFREWLSDNLRYILLGLGIAAALVLLFFGVRFLSTVFEEEDPVEIVEQKEEEPKQKEPEETEPEKQPEAAVTQEPEKEQETEEDTLKKEEYPQVNTLVQNYYVALGNSDVATLKTLVDQLDPEDEKAIANSHDIESYDNVVTYTKKGLTETSYVVFVTYDHKYTGYDTALPGMSCLYVDTTAEGSLYVAAQPTQEQQDRMTAATEEEDVQKLVAATQQAYDQALSENAELADYLKNLGVKTSQAMEAENGFVITAEKNCNVREQASADSAKIAGLVKGQQVTKIGQEGDWIQIETDGLQGFVRGDMFQ